MRVLVTGAAGRVGSRLTPFLRSRGHEVVAAGHNAEEPVEFRLEEMVIDLFAHARPEVVIHLAGTTSEADFSRGPSDARTENIVHPLLNVLAAARDTRVVHVSSGVVFGANPGPEGGSLKPRTLYGAARASAESMALRHGAKGGNIVIARIVDTTNTYGFNDIIMDMIHLMYQGTAGRSYNLGAHEGEIVRLREISQ